MKKKINIMYLIDHFHSIGGTETHLISLVKNLNKDRYNIFIIVFDMGDNPLLNEVRDEGISVIHIPVGRYYTYNALKKALNLARLIKENEIDIIQTFHFKSDFYGALVARLSGVKYVISSKRDVGDRKSKLHFFSK